MSPKSSVNDDLASPSHYVGIGASAGGLEALQEFFAEIPTDSGATFIVVQHLSPDFKSLMPELLSKLTSLPISQISGSITPQANHIYLMPARKQLLINNSKLVLLDIEASKSSESRFNLPIDTFFRTLAESQQHNAIGIILSGTGSDGTQGIKAIKERNGLVIIQEPNSAKFDGMPISAVNTGLADIIAKPDEIARQLSKFINHPHVSNDDATLKKLFADSDDVLNEIFQLLKNKSTINFSNYKASTIARRIERRLGINQISRLDDYLGLLLDSPRELKILSKDLLIGVTRFFRDPKIFKKLQEVVIPALIQKAKERNEPLRIWVAGCSTGEEAYSIAMLVDQNLTEKKISVGVKIFATDVYEESVAEASDGIFSADSCQDLPEEYVNEYFDREGDKLIIKQKIRQMIIFATHNMIEDPPFSNIDFISCRNVLIYFQYAAQKRVLTSLYFALKRDAYLLLGISESLGDLLAYFEIIDDSSKIYRKVTTKRIASIESSLQLRNLTHRIEPETAVHTNNLPLRNPFSSRQNKLDSVQEKLINEYVPDCLVLNESFDAIHIYGDVSAYTKGLRPGRVSNNVKDIIVDDLNVAISTALHRCEKNETDVYYEGVIVKKSEDEFLNIDLSVFRVKSYDITDIFYYVVQFIQKDIDEDKGKNKKILFVAEEQTKQRILDLEQELIKKQEHLQITIEELETTNEELQSANEELQSANEELQSTNEELQSVNEELYTVNSEFQEKNQELTEVNNDLDSVIDASDIGIIFLDENLLIRKYTPVALEYINIVSNDIGRPFHHISHKLDYSDLLTDIADVSKNHTSIEKEISTKEGQNLVVRIIAYDKSTGMFRKGVLITLTNISRLRFMEAALVNTQEELRSTILKSSKNLQRRVKTQDNINLLLLDDSEADRMVIINKLNDKNAIGKKFNVTECESINDAVSALSDNIDICLVDYRLKPGTGKEFVEKIREKGFDTPIILLSGFAEDGLDAHFLNTQVMDFLDKNSLSSELLARSIDYVLERNITKELLDNIYNNYDNNLIN